MHAASSELPTCPACSYILVGLDDPRCPECGRRFTWDSSELYNSRRPAIAFERARGWRRVPAFVATCLTILFAPWIFARQIVSHVSWVHATAFALICFATTLISFAFGCDAPFFVAWTVTAMLYIVAQALLLLFLDAPNLSRPSRSFQFWLCVGGYTSAIVVTEFVNGPPYVRFDGLVEWVSWVVQSILDGDFNYATSPSLTYWKSSVEESIQLLQLILWLTGLACCVFARVHSANRSTFSAAWRSAAALLCLLVLYSLAVEYVGERIYKWLD